MKHLNSFFILAFLTICLLTTKAQTSVVIDPDDYSFTNPYIIPNLPDRSSFYLAIKTGKPTYIKINGMDQNSTVNTSNPSGDNIITINDKLLIDKPGTWGWLYSSNSSLKITGIQVNYQADIYDRTVGSATYGKRPDFIWVNQGESATVSAGPWMKWYVWKNINTQIVLSNNAIDSTQILSKGICLTATDDGSGMGGKQWSFDSISILEKPTFNPTDKTLNFPTTTTGITYKLMKVNTTNGTDTTWTETENFVGDGNAKNITLTDGKYKLATTFGIHTAVYPYGYFVVGITTALDKTKQENLNYRFVDNHLRFDNEVNLKFYTLQGQLLQQEIGRSFKLVRQTGIFTATDKNGKTLTAKILLK